ncbi:unnamed protein product [Owenia fusiformis]|uniref:Eukaryotic translation initiation factor 5 n=1 Tax=Owenia fusiformis TaxID=6347 RepID=A0A8J1Y4A1_OWEFU|nr:unnamed protein product [Owenia fusiformis]
MSVNVNRSVTDPYYRYKMPKIIAKVEGKGNGIKTVIVNMVDVAKALSRPPTYPCKYFGCELGAQTQFDLKNERFIVNGSHDNNRLQDLLDGFIKRFVLCPECDNPETNLIVSTKKNGSIAQRCIACGYGGQIDMRHKLTTFIVKNPPDMDPVSSTPNKKDKKNKKGGKKNEQNGDAEEPSSPEVNQQDQMAQNRAKGGAVDAPPENDGDWENDWGDDTSAEAVKARMQELSGAAKGLTLSNDLEKTQAERIDMFYNHVKQLKDDGMLKESGKEITGEAERLDIKDKAPLILAEILFNDNIVQQIKDYRVLLLRFTHENHKAQKYLLGAFEKIVGELHKKELMPKVALILKTFYDLDVIDEEIIIDWDKKVSKKYVSKAVSEEIHKMAAPFITWLKEAEEEESSEEEEDVEVVYSHSAKDSIEMEKKKEPKKVEEDLDDLDIDDI